MSESNQIKSEQNIEKESVENKPDKMSKPKKIKSKLFISGKIHTLTGLHIGGNSGGLKVGGVDSLVIRETLKNEPYIPGSSLRGKMRSLLERARGPEKEGGEEGGYSKKGRAGENSNTTLGKLFGTSSSEKNEQQQKEPTRLIVRDAFLKEDSAEKLKDASNTDMSMTEVKTEVDINRITSRANPREFERVPAGAIFEAEFILTILDTDTDNEKVFLSRLFEALDLIEGDSLGGSGSRGYGKVSFKEFKITKKTAESYRNGEKGEKEYQSYNIPEKFKKSLKDS